MDYTFDALHCHCDMHYDDYLNPYVSAPMPNTQKDWHEFDERNLKIVGTFEQA